MREAKEEAARIYSQIEHLQDDARQVQLVLQAFNMEVPPFLAMLAGTGAPEEGEPVQRTDEMDRLDPNDGGAHEPQFEREEGQKQEPAEVITGRFDRPEEAPTPEESRQRVGIEAMPEHLRGMPASQRHGPPAQRLKAAQLQYEILQNVNSHQTVVGTEVARELDTASARIADHLRDLYNAGLIERTGINRHDHAKMEEKARKGIANPGRASIEYKPVRKKSVEPEEDIDPEAVEPDFVAKVRDAAVKMDGIFGPLRLARMMNWDPAMTLAALRGLALRGVLAEMQDEGVYTFRYSRPDDPGRAAQMDMEQRSAQASSNSVGAMEVEGTGRGIRAANKDTQAILNAAKKAKAKVEEAGSSHYRITVPDGRRFMIAGTPSRSGLVKDKANARRHGLEV